MEVLSSIFSAMKLTGGVFLEADFGDPWCLASQMKPATACPGSRRRRT